VAEIGGIVNDELNEGGSQWLQPITTSYFAMTDERAKKLVAEDAKKLDGRQPKSARVLLP
ncbi:MAG TPA: hypothetical protein VH144_00990, partial [Candidatus Saccharimonadales bacterium]|nr:hypothetical protein [Candidatus Saccharimonadales bacterium]